MLRDRGLWVAVEDASVWKRDSSGGEPRCPLLLLASGEERLAEPGLEESREDIQREERV